MTHIKPFRRSTIAFGDCAVVITGKQETKSITLKEGAVMQTRFGALKHNECVGKPYGSKVKTSRGHVELLPLDPVLWSVSLPHRTQIIYPPDASLIVGSLDLVPGLTVFEAGTGSGSLTHFLAQAVWPTGHVHTFEFHEGRVGQAREEFQEHGLSNLVSVSHRDVCAEGFPAVGTADNPVGVDAIMLDLPQPWLVIAQLTNVFRPQTGGRICSFSPCIEQVQRTCTAMEQLGFIRIQTFECLQRQYDVARAYLNVPNMGQVGMGAQSDEIDASSQPWNRYHILPPPVNSQQQLPGIKSVEIDDIPCAEDHKRLKLDNEAAGSLKKDVRRDKSRFSWEAIPQTVMSGHTGYLTFASWLPSVEPPNDEIKKPDLHS